MSQTHSLDLEASSSQYASISDASQTGLDITGALTLEAWIKVESTPGSGAYYSIISKGSVNGASDTNTQYLFYYDNDSAQRMGFLVRSAGANKVLSVNQSLATGVWYHVAATYEPSTAMRIYLNGREIANTTASVPASLVNTARFVGVGVGDNGGAASMLFDGLIKDARIFNDVRTQTEIVADARTENVSNANLVGEWNFNNAYTDSSGNGNTLTASGSPTFSTDRPWVASTQIDGSTYLETNLVSYWTLDEVSGNRADSHGSNTLTDNNTVGSTTGKISNAGDFELSNSESLSITNGSQSGLGVSGTISVSTWIKLESTPSNEIRAIVAKDNSSNNNQSYLFGYREDGGPKGLHVRLSSGGTDATTQTGLWSWTPTLDTWYHVVFVYDSSQSTAANRVVVYIDGISQGTVATSWVSSLHNSSAAFRLGGTDNSKFWDGLIDETAIYSRALHYGDVLDLYNAGSGITYSAASGPANLKSRSGNLKANIKSMSGNLIANVKTLSGNS